MADHFGTSRKERIFTEQVIYQPGIYMPPHTDGYSRISIIMDGVMNETACLENISASAGHVVIKPAHVIHENRFSTKPVNLLTIGFTDEGLFNAYFEHWQVTNHPRIFAGAFRLWSALHHAKSDRQMEAGLMDFTAYLQWDNGAKNSNLYWVKKLENLLRDNLTEAENITSLAASLALHRVYMGRVFKKLQGLSPAAYRKKIKLATALIQLITTDQSLAAIAFDSGFADQSHMSREIKKATGATPRAIRNLTHN